MSVNLCFTNAPAVTVNHSCVAGCWFWLKLCSGEEFPQVTKHDNTQSQWGGYYECVSQASVCCHSNTPFDNTWTYTSCMLLAKTVRWQSFSFAYVSALNYNGKMIQFTQYLFEHCVLERPSRRWNFMVLWRPLTNELICFT